VAEASPSARAGQDKEAAMAAIARVATYRIDVAPDPQPQAIKSVMIGQKKGNNRVCPNYSIP
jgi:hypothetical protein